MRIVYIYKYLICKIRKLIHNYFNFNFNFLSKESWSFTFDNLKDENDISIYIFLFFTINKGEYVEEIIKIDTSKEKIDISKEIYKNGFYTFNDKFNIFQRKIIFSKN